MRIAESTLYRERSRNSKKQSYQAKYAQMIADERKKEGHYKTVFSSSMEKLVRKKLALEWPPEQIVGWCKLEQTAMVSHERIYQFIGQDKSNAGTLYTFLRTVQKKYKKRYGSKSSRGQIPNKVSIEQRPEEVDLKQRVGDFENDLIIGKDHKGAFLTIIDRYSSFLFVEDVKGKRSENITKHTINALAPFKKWVHTITNKNGKEFARHEVIADKLDCKVFFANPYSSWERGLNEYTNKLLRQYFPKNDQLDNMPTKTILEAVEKLNNRPKKI